VTPRVCQAHKIWSLPLAWDISPSIGKIHDVNTIEFYVRYSKAHSFIHWQDNPAGPSLLARHQHRFLGEGHLSIAYLYRSQI